MAAADEANHARYYPDDLNKNNQAKTGQDYFLEPVIGLKINSGYSFQFAWKYPDGTVGPWSDGLFVATAAVAVPPKPKLISADITYFQGILKVNWDGTDYNNTAYGNGFSRILIFIRDNTDASPSFKILGELTKPGVFQIAVPPRSQTVKLAAITVNGEISAYSDEFTVIPVLTPPLSPTSVTAAWSGTDFTVSFTSDPSNSANQYLKEYLVSLTASDNQVKVFSLLPKTGSSQKFSLSLESNQAAFGAASQSFSGSIQTLDIYGNKGTVVSFASLAYVSALTTPTITVSAITNGYSVAYTEQTSNTFQFISIEEVVSNSSTDPGTGYSGVGRGSSNPIVIPTANSSKRWVRARLFDRVNASTSYSTAVSVTPLNPVTVDNDGPPDVATVTTSGGLDSSGTIGFNGYADISWTAVTTGGIRGYRIRYRPVTNPVSSYSHADSLGSATSYRLTGLGAGLTYEISVATYDEYNNTSSNYVSGTNVVVGGTPYIASTVDVTGFFRAKANSGDADSTAFKFGYGVDTGKRGLVFTPDNYWYIDSNQSASLKVGGSTTNYIQWNGSSFVIDGDLRAKKGSFSGNVSIASGASLYSGTLTGNTITTTGDTGGSLSGAGYILNSSGLTFNSASVSGITTIAAATGLFTTQSANIGGWLINTATNPDQIYKVSGTNAIKLDASLGSVQADGTGYTAGFGLPDANNIVFWAGSSRAAAPFKVYKDGSVSLPAAVFTGYATSGDLSGKISTGGAASDVNSNTTTISGAKIRTGSIQSATFNSTVTNGSDFSTSGMNISLDNGGSITSKFFRINESGSAFFKGTLDAGISISSPVITGGAITIPATGTALFTVTSGGALTASSANITGTLTIDANNAWSPSAGFKMGGTTSYIQYAGSTITLKSGTVSQTDDALSNPDGGTAVNPRDSIGSEIQLNAGTAGLTIKGLASLGNYTRYAGGGQYTNVEANDNNSSYGMGRAARLRTIVQDYYDDKLYRGFAVYYGSRSSAPSGSTGLVGDLWVSW